MASEARRRFSSLCLPISGLRHHPKRRRASLVAALHIFLTVSSATAISPAVDNHAARVQAAAYRIVPMKLILIASGSLLALNAFAAGSEAIIKQRAKELSNQNNVRQGVPSPAQPQPPANQTTPPPVTLTPMAKLQTDVSAIKPNSQVTPAQKQQLARSLMALAQGPKKPSSGAVNKLAEDMSAALSQKALSEGTRSRLVQDLNG